MKQDSLANLPVHQLSRRIQQREISPVDLVESCLQNVASREPQLKSFVEVYADDARLAAQAAESAIRAGQSVGPLHGIPVALKDLIEIEGRIYTGGSEVWKERRATRTATLARKLVSQGVIVLGKTHTVEFAMGGWGTNTHRGTPWNPWDMQQQRTPGGSSSGSAAAVAARLVPWAVGTDTGGSIRMPASWCGITGLKTSSGRISNHGIQPLSPTLDTPGPMARCVEDVALLYAAMQGPDPLDPQTAGLPYVDPMPALRRGIRGLRLARMPEGERRYASPEVLEAYDASLQVLASLGAEIVALELPFRFEDVAAYNLRIMAAESYALYHPLIDDASAPLDPHVRPRIAAGKDISARAYLEAIHQRSVMQQQFEQAMQGIDALLTPSTMTTALPLSEVDQTKAPAHYTRFGNYLNLCGLSLPNGFDSQGLPTSLQIICRAHQEDLALRIGWAYEHATEWHVRWPGGLV
ncbi:amidase [Comamonas endophytica]|uniref:Amidase n=1 Tax=Comamonas endophytica TaxID=2949090 RepID=A0ABY6GGD0_9BURK|nr:MULTISPECIES: amidase [unclassified Acidovorax]MCD2513218.1 amidase [Acidovorax sp. D4N7]UYG53437.1 amidase [Acidovorax sp. 5MLIR]